MTRELLEFCIKHTSVEQVARVLKADSERLRAWYFKQSKSFDYELTLFSLRDVIVTMKQKELRDFLLKNKWSKPLRPYCKLAQERLNEKRTRRKKRTTDLTLTENKLSENLNKDKQQNEN